MLLNNLNHLRDLGRHLKKQLKRMRQIRRCSKELRAVGENIFVVDIGAAGKQMIEWKSLKNLVTYIRLDPALKTSEKYDFPVALSANAGNSTLYITHHPGCSSILKPNQEILKDFPLLEDMCSVVSTADVETVTYEQLSVDYQVPKADFIKIDVQGFEQEVLTGFGAELESVIGIKLETHFKEMYTGQPVIWDLIGFLEQKNFKLRDIHTAGPSSGRELLEVDAYFYKEPSNDIQELKLKLWDNIYNLRRFNREWKLGKNWK